MAPGANGLYYLDLEAAASTDRALRSLAERPLPPLPPARCFSQHDLYTTFFSGIPNDEIERLLFGRIDSDGATAVRAFVANDLQLITKVFRQFFDYMSVQKLRTPKGLDWINSNYQRLNQLGVMSELQSLRQMNCTMWYECVREVVSAGESEVKFIVSDHPVATFNSASGPGAPELLYPADPPIDWKGTQTVFPLDSSHCLILTNLEYAKNPALADLKSKRTHARHFGDTIARTDGTIHGRKLSEADVRVINQLIAWRAKRYVGASNRNWLQQATASPPDPHRLAEILRAPKDELWHFGGTTYVGFADGTSKSWDEFGRTEPEREFLKKPRLSEPPNSGEACPCSSGRVFSDCCEGRDSRDRMPWDVWSIRERNLRFIDAVTRVLGFRDGKTWLDVRREISAEQVRTIHILFEGLWPPDMDFGALLPRPDARRVRAIYMGIIDPRTIASSVISWLPYFDEIVAIHPFVNARNIRPEYSPIESPDQHKTQTLKNVMLLMSLQPFIERGWVHLVPDPMEFSAAIRQTILSFGEQYRNTRPSPMSQDPELKLLAKDDFERSMLQCSDDSLRRLIRKSSSQIEDQQLESILKYMKRKKEADPLALLQGPLGRSGEMMMMRGVSVPIALFLANLVGAMPYTDLNSWLGNLKDFAVDPDDKEAENLSSIALSLRSSQLIFETNPEFALQTRDVDVFVEFRNAFREMWNTVCEGGFDLERADSIATRISDSSRAADERARTLLADLQPSVRVRRSLDCLIPSGGLSMREAHRLLLTFGHRRHLSRIPMALLGNKPKPLEG